MSLPKLPGDPLARLNTLHQLLSLGRPNIAVHEDRRYRGSLSLPPWVLSLVARSKDTEEGRRMVKMVKAMTRSRLVASSHDAKVEAARVGCEILEMLVETGKMGGVETGKVGGVETGKVGRVKGKKAARVPTDTCGAAVATAVSGETQQVEEGGKEEENKMLLGKGERETQVKAEAKVPAKRKRAAEDDNLQEARGSATGRASRSRQKIGRVIKVEESEDEEDSNELGGIQSAM